MTERTTTDAIIELLAETWPRCFSVYEQRRKPLKVGIRDDLLQRLDGAITAQELGVALRYYCNNKIYRGKLLKGAWRFDLNGDVAGVVEENFTTCSKSQPQRLEGRKTCLLNVSQN